MKRILMAACVLLALGAGAAEPNGLVVLCTDYGADSIYVGAIKGAIYTKAPAARVDSLTNSIPAYNILAGAFILLEGAGNFPPGTVFCAVVDPGVGTNRRGIALETMDGRYFVGPDNGLLSGIATRHGIRALHVVENPALWREGDGSTTFHGRDIFGPVAAALATGTPIAEVGSATENLRRITLPAAGEGDGEVFGIVVRTDDYGNVVTNIPGKLLDALGVAEGEAVAVKIGGESFTATRARTYAAVEVGARLVCVQSVGLVEIAINQGDLAGQLGVKGNPPVVLRKPESGG